MNPKLRRPLNPPYLIDNTYMLRKIPGYNEYKFERALICDKRFPMNLDCYRAILMDNVLALLREGYQVDDNISLVQVPDKDATIIRLYNIDIAQYGKDVPMKADEVSAALEALRKFTRDAKQLGIDIKFDTHDEAGRMHGIMPVVTLAAKDPRAINMMVGLLARQKNIENDFFPTNLTPGESGPGLISKFKRAQGDPQAKFALERFLGGNALTLPHSLWESHRFWTTLLRSMPDRYSPQDFPVTTPSDPS